MNSTACPYCSTQLSYPATSIFIQCPKCSQTFNAQQTQPPTSYVTCLSCQTLLSHPPSSLTIQCPKCLYIMDIAPRANVISGGSDTKNSSNRKKRKDPNAPKRASNAYMIFCKERRAQLKLDRPDLPFGQLGKRLGDMWRSMTAEEKKPYEDRATNDRDRYKGEMNSYQSASMMKQVNQATGNSNNVTNNSSSNNYSSQPASNLPISNDPSQHNVVDNNMSQSNVNNTGGNSPESEDEGDSEDHSNDESSNKKLKSDSNAGQVGTVNVGTADHSNDQQQSYDQYQSQVQQPSEPLQS